MEIHVNSCWVLEADGNDLECITINSTVTLPVWFCLCRTSKMPHLWKGGVQHNNKPFFGVFIYWRFLMGTQGCNSTLLWRDIKFLLPATVYVHAVCDRWLWIQSSSHRELLSARRVEAAGNLREKKFGAVFSCCFFVKFCSRFCPKTKDAVGKLLFSNLTRLMGLFTLLSVV